MSYDSGNCLLSRKLSSLSTISTYASLFLYENKCIDNNNVLQVRKLWTFSPLCMGRRSSKIAGRKVLSLSFFFWLWIISLGTDHNGILLVCAHWLNDLFGKVMSMICNFMCLMKCLIEVRCFTSILIWVWFFWNHFLTWTPCVWCNVCINHHESGKVRKTFLWPSTSGF